MPTPIEIGWENIRSGAIFGPGRWQFGDCRTPQQHQRQRLHQQRPEARYQVCLPVRVQAPSRPDAHPQHGQPGGHFTSSLDRGFVGVPAWRERHGRHRGKHHAWEGKRSRGIWRLWGRSARERDLLAPTAQGGNGCPENKVCQRRKRSHGSRRTWTSDRGTRRCNRQDAKAENCGSHCRTSRLASFGHAPVDEETARDRELFPFPLVTPAGRLADSLCYASISIYASDLRGVLPYLCASKLGGLESAGVVSGVKTYQGGLVNTHQVNTIS